MAFKTYKDVITGKFADYPEDVGVLFYDRLVEVDPDTLQCLDCAKHEEKVAEQSKVPASKPDVTTDDKSKDNK